MALTGNELAEIFGLPQLIGADWQISGNLKVTKDGSTLSMGGGGLSLVDSNGKVLFSLAMDGTLTGDITPLTKIKASDISGAAKNQFGVFSETFEDELSGWADLIRTATPTFPLHGDMGGKVLTTSGALKIVHTQNIPYSPDKTYRLKIRAKKISGSPTLSAGVLGIAADGVTKISTTGANTYDDPHYFCLSNTTPASSFTTYTGWIKGFDASPHATPSTDPVNPNGLMTGIKYIRPIIYIGGGVLEVDDFSIDITDDISDGVITASKIVAGSITADLLDADYITVGGAAADVNAGVTTISGGKITTGSVTADRMDVDDLSAITASLGTITSGTVTGATIQTEATAERGIKLTSGSLKGYNALGVETFSLTASDGSLSLTGAITAAVGSSLPATYLSGTIDQARLSLSNRGWTQTCAFSMLDLDTVQWGSGTLTSADGTVYNISAGNTGNMIAKTFIYLDLAVSTTAYQVTTTSATAVGAGKVLVAVAQNGAVEPTWMVFSGGQNLNGSDIVAASITTNEIAANTIKAGNIEAGTITANELAADYIEVGDAASDVNAGVTTINGGQITTASISTMKMLVPPGTHIVNPDPYFKDAASWPGEGSNTFITISDGKVGLNAIRSASGAATAAFSQDPHLDVDPNKVYRLSCWVRRKDSADGVVYLGLHLFDGTDTVIGGPWWWWASAVQPTNNVWTEYTATFGPGTTQGVIDSSAKKMAIFGLSNHLGSTGYYEFQFYRIEEVIGTVLIQDGAITADKIYVGSVTADKVSAGAITTSKLLVVPESICPDPYFLDEAWWTATLNQGWQFQTRGVGSPDYSNELDVLKCAYLTAATAGSGQINLYSTYTPFSGVGQSLTFKFRAKNPSNQALSVYAVCRDKDLTATAWNVTNVPAGSAAADYVLTFVVPAGTTQIGYILANASGSTMTDYMSVSGMKLFQTADADMIVDGSITADHIAAGTITADELAADCIYADKIVAGEIEYTHMSEGAVLGGWSDPDAPHYGNATFNGDDAWHELDVSAIVPSGMRWMYIKLNYGGYGSSSNYLQFRKHGNSYVYSSIGIHSPAGSAMRGYVHVPLDANRVIEYVRYSSNGSYDMTILGWGP